MRLCQITGVGSVSEARGRAPAARKAPSSRPHAARDVIVGARRRRQREAPSCDAIARRALRRRQKAQTRPIKVERRRLVAVRRELAAEDAWLRPQLLALVHRPQLLVFVGGPAPESVTDALSALGFVDDPRLEGRRGRCGAWERAGGGGGVSHEEHEEEWRAAHD